MALLQGKREILEVSKQIGLPFDQKVEDEFVETFMDSIDSFFLVGPELLLSRLFDEIGFNAIEDKLFRQLVSFGKKTNNIKKTNN